MSADAALFWLLAIVTLVSGLSVVLVTNPIYSALSLAMTMVGVSALFVTLEAYFIAGVQLIVYAGAVMVLFVMVIMLFDLKTEVQSFTKGPLSGALKLGSVGVLAGLIVGALIMSSSMLSKEFLILQKPTAAAAGLFTAPGEAIKTDSSGPKDNAENVAKAEAGPDFSTKKLGQTLFMNEVFGFEALGLLLLVIAVGTVALARSRGGTHARR